MMSIIIAITINLTINKPSSSSSKTVLDFEFHAVDSRFRHWIPDHCQRNLDSGFQSLVGFRIPKPVFRISIPKTTNSRSKYFQDIQDGKNAFLDFKNKKFKKSKNRDFSKKVNSWFWSKIGHFSIFFFLGNIGQENVFYDIVERKKASLGYKNKQFKRSKNSHFSKGVNPWFWLKVRHFSIFFLAI